ncbi:MAG: o-succinylbenzoate--CoA ligase [Melioribacteraceae bacterium]
MVTIPNTNYWLIEQSKCFENKTAVLAPNTTFSYQQLLNQAITTAALLHSKGIDEGDNVCILSSHCYEFWLVVNALWFLGAVPVPLNTRNTKKEISWQINHVKAKHLITLNTPHEAKNVNQIMFDDFDFQANSSVEASILHSTFYTLRSSLILFTSGSTGKPKAVVHTFHSMYESVKAIDSKFNLNKSNKWLASLPLYHIGGFMILVRALLTGSEVVFPASLNHADLLSEMKKSNPSHVSLVSTTLQRILDEKIESNTNLEYVFLGGGPLSQQACERAIDAGYQIVKVYGSTETCSMVTALKPEEIGLKPDSVGKALSDEIKIKVANESREILISSPSLFKEYFNDESATKAKFIDGFYNTGDFGRIDEGGYLYIDLRREDIIISGGENVSAREVESALLSIDTIKDAVVFGVFDITWGQKLCAAVVTSQFDETSLIQTLKGKLAGYKIPKQFFTLSEIPRNEMGKVKREMLMNLLNLDEA